MGENAVGETHNWLSPRARDWAKTLSAREEQLVAAQAHSLADAACEHLGECAAEVREELRTCSGEAVLNSALSTVSAAVAARVRGLLAQADSFYWQLALSGTSTLHWEAARTRLSRTHRADLMQLGHVGLFKAARRFEPARGLRFSTFARWWVRAEMQEALQRYGRLVRLPSSAAESRARIDRLREAHRDDGLPTDDQTIADALGLSLRRVRLLSGLQGGTSIDEEVNGVPLRDLLDCEDSSEADLMSIQQQQQLEGAFERLSEREQEILCRHFGLRGHSKETLSAIGDRLSISRERVRQLEKLALRSMAAYID